MNKLLTILFAILFLPGCVSFRASDSTGTNEPNWTLATLFNERTNVAHNMDCVYRVDATQKIYTINNLQSCWERVEIDVNSYQFTVVGVPILMGGMTQRFNYRPLGIAQKPIGEGAHLSSSVSAESSSSQSPANQNPVAPWISDTPGPDTKFKSRDFSKTKETGPSPGD